MQDFDWNTLELEKKDCQSCDHFGCDQEGLFPAPKNAHQLKERYYFCLDHVKAYNDQWNYLDQLRDASPEDCHHDDTPHHPFQAKGKTFSKFFSQNPNDPLGVLGGDDQFESTPTPTQKFFSPKTQEGKAFVALDLSWPFTKEDLKQSYKTMAKKHHPDLNHNDPLAIEKFRNVKESYELLSSLINSLYV